MVVQRVLNKETLKLKDQGLTITALKENIKRLEEVIAGQAKKMYQLRRADCMFCKSEYKNAGLQGQSAHMVSNVV